MKILKNLSIVLVTIIMLFYSIPSLALDNKFNNVNKGLTLDQKIGMNGFVDCKLENLTAGGILREYHNFGWTYDANSGKCYFQSSWFDFDQFYKNVNDAGITILPCIQQGNNKENREYKPVEDGANTTDPASYKIHSNVLFNYAARYGSTKVAESKLNLTPSTEAKSGLGYITYYENWNEPDKTWIGEKACFSPEEFAAMCSADYDGHEGALGDTYGIKQADPNAKLVYGGLAGGTAGVEYLNRMKAWSEKNRPSGTLPFDVINFHMYCGTHSPEASNFVESAMALIEWRNANAPDKEIWITEFGWDTNTKSPRSAPSYDTQRDWIIREYLIADRIGLDRAIVFNGRDDGSPESTTQYSTCGLTTQKGKEERKSSWYGVNTLKTTLSGFKLSNVIREDLNLYVYKYTNTTTKEDCYVIWSPTENGSTVNYKLYIKNIKNATLTELKDKNENGVQKSLNIEDNTIKLNVSESPVFVKVKYKDDTATSEPSNTSQEIQLEKIASTVKTDNTGASNSNNNIVVNTKNTTQNTSKLSDSTISSQILPKTGISENVSIAVLVADILITLFGIFSFVLYINKK